jgi:uncharacterized protein with ATP-grasp and redox domains
MEILLDCVPCLLKQALEGSKLATDHVEIQEKVIKDALAILSDYKAYKTSPELARAIHQCIKENTGLDDPYALVKARDLQAAKSMYKALKEFLQTKEDQLYWALKISATGNNIDSAIYQNVKIDKSMMTELEKEFAICNIDILRKKLVNANHVLVIGDNTGETIFDKVLIEALHEMNVTYVVRSEPIINDVTMLDAIASELNKVASLISSGCNAPGLILEECSDDFMKLYKEADVIISKGQGNYEALSEEKEVFFLLKAKCPMIAGRLNVNINNYVLKYGKGE